MFTTLKRCAIGYIRKKLFSDYKNVQKLEYREEKYARLSWFFTAPVYVLYVTKSTQSKVVGARSAPNQLVIFLNITLPITLPIANSMDNSNFFCPFPNINLTSQTCKGTKHKCE
jgi:hypothetical protein